MNMKDANTGEEIWRSSHWDAVTMFDEEIQGKLMLLTFFCERLLIPLYFRANIERHPELSHRVSRADLLILRRDKEIQVNTSFVI